MVFYSALDLHLKKEKSETQVQHRNRQGKSTNRERKQQFVLNQNFIAYKKDEMHTKKILLKKNEQFCFR